MEYTIPKMSCMLGVSTSTIQEVKKKLKIKRNTNEEDFRKIERFINDVRKTQDKTSLSAINQFLATHKLGEYKHGR